MAEVARNLSLPFLRILIEESYHIPKSIERKNAALKEIPKQLTALANDIRDLDETITFLQAKVAQEEQLEKEIFQGLGLNDIPEGSVDSQLKALFDQSQKHLQAQQYAQFQKTLEIRSKLLQKKDSQPLEGPKRRLHTLLQKKQSQQGTITQQKEKQEELTREIAQLKRMKALINFMCFNRPDKLTPDQKDLVKTFVAQSIEWRKNRIEELERIKEELIKHSSQGGASFPESSKLQEIEKEMAKQQANLAIIEKEKTLAMAVLFAPIPQQTSSASKRTFSSEAGPTSAAAAASSSSSRSEEDSKALDSNKRRKLDPAGGADMDDSIDSQEDRKK